jgi:transforming growth factor-beta-induced protein
MKRFTVPSMLLVLAILVGACAAPATPEPTPMPVATEAPVAELGTVVDIAVADGRFTTLVGALKTAGLVEALQGEGPFTVFAPTDDAFAALPAGTLEGLSVEQLTDILLYHVVPGKVMAADAVALAGQSAGTLLEGKQIAISVEGESVKINGATVIIADIEASNGVIHVIDAVLLPPE